MIDSPLTRSELQASAPALVDEIRAEAAADERKRVVGILALLTRTNGSLAVAAISDGSSVEQFALRALLADQATTAAAAQAHFADAPLPVPSTAAPADTSPQDRRDELHRAVLDHMKANEVNDYAAALRAVVKEGRA